MKSTIACACLCQNCHDLSKLNILTENIHEIIKGRNDAQDNTKTEYVLSSQGTIEKQGVKQRANQSPYKETAKKKSQVDPGKKSNKYFENPMHHDDDIMLTSQREDIDGEVVGISFGPDR